MIKSTLAQLSVFGARGLLALALFLTEEGSDTLVISAASAVLDTYWCEDPSSEEDNTVVAVQGDTR